MEPTPRTRTDPPLDPYAVQQAEPGDTVSRLQVATKAGVRLPRRPEMLAALQIAAARGDVITSGNDGAHLSNSLHHDDLAVDIRPTRDHRAQAARYRNAGYTVLEEGLAGGVGITPGVGTGKHLHVSFDPEGRRV